MMGQPRGTCGAPCLPACMPPVRGSSLHLQAALPGPERILTRFPGEPWLFSGPRSPVVQAGRLRSTCPPDLSSAFPGGTFFAAECLGKRSHKFTASLMSNLLSGALRKQRAELTRLN